MEENRRRETSIKILGFGQQGEASWVHPLIYVFERCSEYVHIKVGYGGGGWYGN